MKRTGELIREARIRHGISQAAVAKAIGQNTEAYISSVENGRAALAGRHIRAVSEFLSIPVDELLRAKLFEFENHLKTKEKL